MKKFRTFKNIKGNDASTLIPKAKNEAMASGSLGEKELRAKDATFDPNRV